MRDDLLKLADIEADQFTKENNLDPTLLRLILRARGSMLAHSIFGNKLNKKDINDKK